MWVDVAEYNKDDLCPICHEIYGIEHAIFKTPCNHMFHNNCLDQYCETYEGNVQCPVCRSNIGNSCMSVWAFKTKSLGNPDGKPLFDSEHIYKIYNSQRGGVSKKRRSKRKHHNKRKQTRKRTHRKRK